MEVKNYLSTQQAEQWTQMVGEARNIVVLGHAGPDGDAMGAILALTHHLHAAGKEVVPITPNACPDFLRWMPGVEQVVFFRNNQSKAQQALEKCDLVFCLDFNSLQRLEDLCPLVENCSAPRIMIDHHLNPDTKAALIVSDSNASATCEILFCILHQLGAYEGMTRNIASCLYCGLMTDTGAFAYNSNRADLFHIIAMLIAKGIDKDQIYRNVYYRYTESRLRLMGYLMNEKMEYFPEEHTALFALTEEEMTRKRRIERDCQEAAFRERLSPKDARGISLICSRQGMVKEFLAGWFGCPFGKLDVVATYNLIYNAAVFVEAGLGAAICIDGMIPQEFADRVVFRPFAPTLVSDVYLAWRKNSALSPAASTLVSAVRRQAVNADGQLLMR